MEREAIFVDEEQVNWSTSQDHKLSVFYVLAQLGVTRQLK